MSETDTKPGGSPGRRKKLRTSRRIRAIRIAPALVTLGNLLCGFAAIHFCARESEIGNVMIQKLMPTNLALACYLVFAAMVCDALDGRLARLSRTTSDFGGQLDSLADIVSFGVAPAFIVVRLVMEISKAHSPQAALISPAADTAFGRFCWIAAGAYLACGALRLARFNVENVHDLAGHMSFKGLPVPGAAGALISFVLLNEDVLPTISPSLERHSDLLATAVPFVAIMLGLLMVSRVPYVHVLNRYLRGKKPFWMLVAAVFVGLAFLFWPKLVVAIGLCGFAVSGPAAWLARRITKRSVATKMPEQ